MKAAWLVAGALAWLGLTDLCPAQDARIVVHADRVEHRLSRFLTGACIEDVNHEIYGGIDSQMIFGESFAEPAPAPVLEGFTAFGGRWTPEGGILRAAAGEGPKLISAHPPFVEGKVRVQIRFPAAGAGNAGLIVKVAEAGPGADAFVGYEISLDTAGALILGRHRRNWEPIRRVPCRVPVGEWISLAVETTASGLAVRVNGELIADYEDKEHPLSAGAVGLRTWQRDADFRDLVVRAGASAVALPFAVAGEATPAVSGMWDAVHTGSAAGTFALETRRPFSGAQSQRIAFTGGRGAVGIANRGLNRRGIHLVRGRPYEGFVRVRAEQGTALVVALESGDGNRVYAESPLATTGSNGWQRLDFALTPDGDEGAGRFTVTLKEPGEATLGYAFLQPGDWGRFAGLPVRRDVAEGLQAQGITVLRLGGCMVNAPGYRWKSMLGPRDHRPPYEGWWYPHASNGWGIFEFLEFCEAAGILGIPAVHMGESPQDMADFIEYANGPADSPWGAKRAANGHPAPYRLRHLQLGNEERVNQEYLRKFVPMAEAIWAKDPEIILVVGDFAYQLPITDPFRITGADSGIPSLGAHQAILRLAKQYDREVWFDVHVWTDGPRPTSTLQGALSFRDALEPLADGARFRVVVFELNANNHTQRRALANALAIQAFARDGQVPVVASANCLQPDGQNDNGWDQGLLFLNPSRVWLQPPGYVTQMIARHYQPLALQAVAESPDAVLDISAGRSEDGRTLVLQVVNAGDQSLDTTIAFEGFAPSSPLAVAEVLAAPLDAANTADNPLRVVPQLGEWEHGITAGETQYHFPPHAFTILTFR